MWYIIKLFSDRRNRIRERPMANEKKTGRVPSWVWTVLRLAIVAVIFYFLFRTGQLDLRKVGSFLRRPVPFAIGTALLIIGGAFGVLRWQKLLEVHGIRVPFGDAMRLTFIGFFFSTVIPGAVTGDVVKAYYVVRGREKKAEAITSIIMDRVLGLWTMIFVAVVVVSLSWLLALGGSGSEVWKDPKVSLVSFLVWGLFLALTAAFAFSWSTRLRHSRLMDWALERAPLKETVRKFYDAVHGYGLSPRPTAVAALYSFIAQAILYVALYFLARTANVEGISAGGYLFLFPVGLVVNALPILPAGLGQGEVGFAWLFNLFHSSHGAEVAFLFHLSFLSISVIIGGFFYLLGKKEYSIHMPEKLS
jgi:uncharacterized protein (TIRG00374 family)